VKITRWGSNISLGTVRSLACLDFTASNRPGHAGRDIKRSLDAAHWHFIPGLLKALRKRWLVDNGMAASILTGRGAPVKNLTANYRVVNWNWWPVATRPDRAPVLGL
jgi:hypothetical protein